MSTRHLVSASHMTSTRYPPSTSHMTSDSHMTSASHMLPTAIPHMHVDMERSYLASRERRRGTARLRREWLDSQYSDDDDRSSLTMRQRLPVYRKFVDRHSRRQKKEDRRPSSHSTSSSIWEDEVIKRNVPERVPFVQTVVLGTAAPRRQPLTDTARHITAMFQNTSIPRDKHRHRIHFIDTDWHSERVSWLRFQQPDVAEIHKRSWLQ